MNDFTKEELNYLYNELDSNYSELKNIPLINKVKLMIVNYCEHENTCDHDWAIGFGSIYSPVTYCKKCSCQKSPLSDDLFNKVMGINKV